MILGIIMTVLGIFGFIVFLYLAYKTAKTPVENEQDKITRFFNKSEKINTGIKINKNYDYLDDIPDETSYLFEEDNGYYETNSDEADLFVEEDSDKFYEELSYYDEKTELLNEETECLEDETELLKQEA